MSMITIKAQVDIGELMESMGKEAWADWRALVDFVRRMDGEVAMWDFTLALADYFDGQRKAHAAEEAAVVKQAAEKQAYLAHMHELAHGGKP